MTHLIPKGKGPIHGWPWSPQLLTSLLHTFILAQTNAEAEQKLWQGADCRQGPRSLLLVPNGLSAQGVRGKELTGRLLRGSSVALRQGKEPNSRGGNFPKADGTIYGLFH